LTSNVQPCHTQTLRQKNVCWVLDLEFNSIDFGIEIKLLTPKIYQENFRKF
jgi:hypothetical protein